MVRCIRRQVPTGTTSNESFGHHASERLSRMSREHKGQTKASEDLVRSQANPRATPWGSTQCHAMRRPRAHEQHAQQAWVRVTRYTKYAQTANKQRTARPTLHMSERRTTCSLGCSLGASCPGLTTAHRLGHEGYKCSIPQDAVP